MNEAGMETHHWLMRFVEVISEVVLLLDDDADPNHFRVKEDILETKIRKSLAYSVNIAVKRVQN
ncbi:MAG TPA: hypothetical protein EYG65_09585 [Rhodospirillales bacterium]|nr:hypothetical protein [Rhodospirillales bacterium]